MPSSTGALSSSQSYHTTEFYGSPRGLDLNFCASAADSNFNDVVVSDLPDGCVIFRVIGIMLIGLFQNAYSAHNYLSGTQKFRVKKSAGTWDVDDIDAIDLDTQHIDFNSGYADVAGFKLVGHRDIKTVVDGNGTYNFQMEDGKAAFNCLYGCGHQAGLRIEFLI